jgi:L-cysteine desulfidase
MESDPRMLLNVASILEFASMVRMEDIEDTIGKQIELNTAIAREGITHKYGTQVGRTILQAYGDKDVRNRAKAMAAAGSDARMNGCPMPVVVNSGSGNQGITCSVPVIVYAKEWRKSQEELYRALVVSNLVSIHQKKYIGSLSAYCGAVSAGCGAGAGIAWLYSKDYDLVCRTITNTIADVSGVVCDGAKSSCAAKIASAVDAAIMGFTLASKSQSFQPGDGVVKRDIEDTIKGIGYIGREGMKDTDVKILRMMIDAEE